MKICLKCWDRQKEQGLYIGPADKQTMHVGDCEIHPTMDNPRVVRTLITLSEWSKRGDGYCHPMYTAGAMTLSGGHIDTVVAKKILFDYEFEFLQFLVSEKYLALSFDKLGYRERETVVLTSKADEFLSQLLTKE